MGPDDRVLDVAGRARAGGGDGSAVGIDPDPGMLTVAERFAPEVDWRMGTGLSEETIEEILAQSERVLVRFVAEIGEVVVPSPGHVVSALKG